MEDQICVGRPWLRRSRWQKQSFSGTGGGTRAFFEFRANVQGEKFKAFSETWSTVSASRPSIMSDRPFDGACDVGQSYASTSSAASSPTRLSIFTGSFQSSNTTPASTSFPISEDTISSLSSDHRYSHSNSLPPSGVFSLSRPASRSSVSTSSRSSYDRVSVSSRRLSDTKRIEGGISKTRSNASDRTPRYRGGSSSSDAPFDIFQQVYVHGPSS